MHLMVITLEGIGYSMVCPPVCGDNPRALARGLSPVHVDSNSITILYHQHKCRTCTIDSKIGSESL